VAGLALALVVLSATSAWLFWKTRDLEGRLAPEGERPTVDRLWRQVLGNGRPTYVVIGDSGLPQVQDLLGFQFSVNEYQRGVMPALRSDRLSPESFAWAERLARQRYTAMADVGLATEAVLLSAANGGRAEVLLAPDVEPQRFRGHNVVLAGTRRSNPWFELFEDRLNFRGHFDVTRRAFWFENQHPLAGEAAEYRVEWGRLSYCRVAFLPGLDGSGNALLVTGGDMSSGSAGATFLTTESWGKRLRERLDLRSTDPFPYFEVLLRVELVASSSSQFDVVAHRILQT
jgi:hypothetical protein